MTRTLVILPSYNERNNVLVMIEALRGEGPDWDILLVDDNSPDGTSTLVTEAIRSTPGWPERVFLQTRENKGGRGSAVREGIKWGYDGDVGYAAFVELDCDFSHPPKDIRKGLRRLEDGADVVLGSRYPDGIIEGWSLRRRVFSFCANRLARALLDSTIADYTNGFRFYSRRAAEILIQQPQRHTGYIYLSESLAHFLKRGMRVEEFPIHFVNRERGVSNTGVREIANAFAGLIDIAIRNRMDRP